VTGAPDRAGVCTHRRPGQAGRPRPSLSWRHLHYAGHGGGARKPTTSEALSCRSAAYWPPRARAGVYGCALMAVVAWRATTVRCIGCPARYLSRPIKTAGRAITGHRSGEHVAIQPVGQAGTELVQHFACRPVPRCNCPVSPFTEVPIEERRRLPLRLGSRGGIRAILLARVRRWTRTIQDRVRCGRLLRPPRAPDLLRPASEAGHRTLSGLAQARQDGEKKNFHRRWQRDRAGPRPWEPRKVGPRLLACKDTVICYCAGSRAANNIPRQRTLARGVTMSRPLRPKVAASGRPSESFIFLHARSPGPTRGGLRDWACDVSRESN